MKKREGLALTEIVGEDLGYLGGALSFVGDLDADSYEDFVLVAQGGNGEWGSAGSAYLFYGRATFPARLDATDADLVLRGASESVAALGDVDRDGYPDFAFTSHCYTTECAPTNGVHLVYGGSQRYSGEFASNEVGSQWTLESEDVQYERVSSAGDPNSDGHADLLFDVSIREPGMDDPRRSGFLLFGREDRSEQMPTGTDFDLRFDARNSETEQLVGIDSPGDLDADGNSDFVMSTIDDRVSDITERAIWLFYGSQEPEQTQFDPNLADASIEWSEANHLERSAAYAGVIRLGDLAGDGYDDLVFSTVATDGETLHVFNGRGDRIAGKHDLGLIDWSFTTPSGNVRQLSSGDVDADGRLDLVIGDWDDSDHAGALFSFLAPGYRLPGSRDLSREDVLLYGQRRSSANDRLGAAVASGGDANADGRDDILVSAPGDFIGDPDGGRVFLVFGSHLD